MLKKAKKNLSDSMQEKTPFSCFSFLLIQFYGENHSTDYCAPKTVINHFQNRFQQIESNKNQATVSSPDANTARIKKTFTKKLHLLVLPCLLMFCLLFPHSVYAKKTLVLIITNNHLKIHNKISNLLKTEFQKNETLRIETHHYQSITQKQVNQAHASLIITLGTNSLKLAPPSSTPTIHALIPRKSLQQKDFCQMGSCPEKLLNFPNSYSIYLDHPLARQLNFISLLLPSAKKIGVLTAPFSVHKVKTILTEASRLNLTVVDRHIEHESELSKELNKLIKNIDVLFTLPDQLIHNSSNIPYLLLSTYRYNIPVIGFSKAYVNAGAVAAIYSSPEQIIRQIIELAEQIINNPIQINGHHFPPKYFSIAVNNNVALSLELHLPDTQIIKSKLLQLEK